MILSDGRITIPSRPEFAWRSIKHTDTKNNRRIWTLDRPVPLNYDVPMAWHHIIPWKDLRDGWSALATSHRWEVLKKWIELLEVPDVNGTIKKMQSGTLSPSSGNSMLEKLCWAKWNLVEGPSNRTDDPGSDALDVFNGARIPNNVRDRSNILNLIHGQIKLWNSTKSNIKENETRHLVANFSQLRKYKNSPISAFNPKVWVLVSESRRTASGSPLKHATWKKNL